MSTGRVYGRGSSAPRSRPKYYDVNLIRFMGNMVVREMLRNGEVRSVKDFESGPAAFVDIHVGKDALLPSAGELRPGDSVQVMVDRIRRTEDGSSILIDVERFTGDIEQTDIYPKAFPARPGHHEGTRSHGGWNRGLSIGVDGERDDFLLPDRFISNVDIAHVRRGTFDVSRIGMMGQEGISVCFPSFFPEIAAELRRAILRETPFTAEARSVRYVDSDALGDRLIPSRRIPFIIQAAESIEGGYYPRGLFAAPLAWCERNLAAERHPLYASSDSWVLNLPADFRFKFDPRYHATHLNNRWGVIWDLAKANLTVVAAG